MGIEKLIEGKKKEINKLFEYNKTSIILNFDELSQSDLELADKLIEDQTQIEIISEKINKQYGITLIPRIINLPNVYHRNIKTISTNDVGTFLSVEGLVLRCTPKEPKVIKGLFACVCGEEVSLDQNESKYELNIPKCKNCDKLMFLVPEKSKFLDFQKIEIQEPLESILPNQLPRLFECWVTNDLVNSVCAGDRVLFNGHLKIKAKRKEKNTSIMDWFLFVNSVEVQSETKNLVITTDDYNQIKKMSKDTEIVDKLGSVFFDKIYDYKELKKVLILSMVGGSNDINKDNANIHVLMIGDPGIAKSQILELFKLASTRRAIIGSGKQSTKGGLTAIPEKDEFSGGKWTIKAGLLVLCNKGFALLDELDKLENEVLHNLLQAMSAKHIDFNKAGISTRLNADTTVIAAANPKMSRFDPHEGIVKQFNIDPLFLSRCDYILALQDKNNRKHDKELAKHIRSKRILPYLFEISQKYIEVAHQLNPIIPETLGNLIDEAYVNIRAKGTEGRVSSTPRNLNAIKRSTEAFAKLRLSNECNQQDLDNALSLLEYVYSKVCLDEKGNMDADLQNENTHHDRTTFYGVLGIITDYCNDPDNKFGMLMPEKELKEQLALPKENYDKLIHQLKVKGEILEPKCGFFKNSYK